MTSSSNYARFIPSEEIDAQAVRHWKFGDMDSMAPGMVAARLPELAVLDDLLRPPASTRPEISAPAEAAVAEEQAAASGLREDEVQALVEQARQEAQAAGHQAGLQVGREAGLAEGLLQKDAEWHRRFDDYQAQQGQQVAQALQGVLYAAQREVHNLQQAMAPDVLQLACDIARQVVRQELRSNPQALLPVVREALDMMSADTKPVTVRLNPQDWTHLQAPLKEAHPQPKIEWLVDASVNVGDCKVESAGAQVDGGVERRWQRAVAALGLVSTWYDGAPAHGQ